MDKSNDRLKNSIIVATPQTVTEDEVILLLCESIFNVVNIS